MVTFTVRPRKHRWTNASVVTMFSTGQTERRWILITQRKAFKLDGMPTPIAQVSSRQTEVRTIQSRDAELSPSPHPQGVGSLTCDDCT